MREEVTREASANRQRDGFKVVPNYSEAEKGTSGQCIDCYSPPLNHVPTGSAQYGLALTKFNEDELEVLYDYIQDNFNEAVEEYKESGNEKDKPKHSLIIFDDMSFDKDLKKSKSIERIFCNGRHIGLNVILTAQKYTQIPTCARENATGVILFASSDKQLDLITEEHNFLDNKKQFKKMVKDHTVKEPHSFIIFNYSNPFDTMYMNKFFQPIDIKNLV